MITCLPAARAFAPLDAATPYRFNHDASKVGTCTLPDERQCADDTRVTDPAVWPPKRRDEILRSFAATTSGVTPATPQQTARRRPPAFPLRSPALFTSHAAGRASKA
ncbi:MAG: hypothetical protein RLZZ162_1418 [Verrucomicrobiota bacterium]